MSQLSDVATVRLLVADYAVVDVVGKMTVAGGLVTVLAANPAFPGMTAPFWLAVWISVPPTHYDAQCVVEMLLEDSSGAPVGFANPQGERDEVRIVQDVTFPKPNLPEQFSEAEGDLPARAQSVIAFSFGLPLPAGKRYAWRVQVDGESRDDWLEEFVVISQPVLRVTHPMDAPVSPPAD